ncbi:hypothetical protein NP233_g6128 [Leucocoprinus birnbaumii]|uniref:Autophagy-related protein 13 n=1 Tax=Leucocoprinus birnbaumii TaxID=56174 RepID=A0AAD5YVU4_9AGAR|nr:hypothetical protein NP233_g6128 [Leucocoprinus birnbaumii]
MMEAEQQQKTDQIAYHFYTKLFSLVHDARVTADSHTLRHDKWFNLESPDSDLFTKDARDLYKSITRHRPPPFELEVVLCIPELSPNQAVVYLPPSSNSTTRRPLEPTPELIVLEVWSVSLSGGENAGVTPPPIYKHGMALFRSIYTLLRTLPSWGLYKRIRRRIPARAMASASGAGALSISVRLRPPRGELSSSGSSSLHHRHQHHYQLSSSRTLEFNQHLSPHLPPIPTSTQEFPPVQLPPGTLTFSVTYLTNPSFEIDELESVLSSRFVMDDVGGEMMNAGEGFVPTLLNKSSSTTAAASRVPSGTGSRGNSPPGPGLAYPSAMARGGSPATRSPMAMYKEPSESIAERFILPSKNVVGGPVAITGSPRDPLARLRKESVSAMHHHSSTGTTPSPTTSPRQRKLSLNSSSPSSSITEPQPIQIKHYSISVPLQLLPIRLATLEHTDPTTDYYDSTASFAFIFSRTTTPAYVYAGPTTVLGVEYPIHAYPTRFDKWYRK